MKYALVTGGSRGIGRAICIQLAKDGYHVIVNYLSNHEAARGTLRLITEAGGEAELLPFDVSKPEEINAAMDKWQSEHADKYIEVLVNNAGIVRDNLMLDMPVEDWHAVVDTNLNGFFYVTRKVLEGMLMNHQGRIINISSISGINGYPGKVNYSSAKAAIIGGSKSLAAEVASRKITVNVIAPGMIDTDIANEEDKKKAKENCLMRRIGEPREVAYLVSFLASDKAAFITGQVIGIDGGGFV